MTMTRSILLLLVALGTRASLAADEWHTLGNYHWDSRVSLVIENPSSHRLASLYLPLALRDLTAHLPGAKAGHVAVVDPKAGSARVGDSCGALFPFQVSRDNVVLLLSFEPKERKRLYLYSSREPVPTPVFEKKTATDVREAFRSFESNLMGFRMEVGPRANTTGMAIDVFGKTTKGKGLQLRRFYGFLRDQNPITYHQPSPWGMDILKVGTSPGLGGLYLFADGKTARPDAKETEWKVVTEGPILTTIHAKAPVRIGKRNVTVARSITLMADDRRLMDFVQIQGKQQDLDGVLLGVGLRNLPEEKWTQNTDLGYALVSGAGTEQGTKEIGLGMVFEPKAYVRTETVDGQHGAHIIVLKPQETPIGFVSRHLLEAYWDKDPEITTSADFEEALKSMASAGSISLKTDLGKLETREVPLLRTMSRELVAINPSTLPSLMPPSAALDRRTATPEAGQTVELGGQRLLFADVRLGPLETRRVTLGRARSSAFQISRADGGQTRVGNGWATWVFDSSGLRQVERDGKRLTVGDSAKASSAVEVSEGPIVCVVSAGGREYLLAKDSPAWLVSASSRYELSVQTGDTQKFYYSHVDPNWNPRLHIEFFQPAFYLLYPADFATLFNEQVGLGVTVVPQASSRRWVIRETGKGTRVFAMEPLSAEMPRFQSVPDTHFPMPPAPKHYTAFFALVEEPTAGEAILHAAATPMLMVREQDNTWAHRADIDGDGFLDTVRCEPKGGTPDFDTSTYTWDMASDGTLQGKFVFGSIEQGPETATTQKARPDLPAKPWSAAEEKRRKHRTLSFFGDVDNFHPDGMLNDREQKHPVVVAHDWTGRGELAHGGIFRGGMVSCGHWRMQGLMTHYVSQWTPLIDLDSEFQYRWNAQSWGDAIGMDVFDIDGDGDLDAVKGIRDHPDSSIVLDLGDMNPLVMLLFDPTRGYATGNGGDLHATNTDNWTGFWGGRAALCDGKPVLVGHHDWPQMFFSVDDRPAPTHRMYTYTQHAPKPGLLYFKRFAEGKYLDHYVPMRTVINLDGERKDISGYSYVNRNVQGFRHWNTCLYAESPIDTPQGKTYGPLYEADVCTFVDRQSGKIVRAAGPYMPSNWDGKRLSAIDEKGRPRPWVRFWQQNLETKWTKLVATFQAIGGRGPEDFHSCVSVNPLRRWDVVVGANWKPEFYASPFIANFHLRGARFGHRGFGRADNALFVEHLAGPLYDYMMYSLDADIQRYYYSSYLAYFDLNSDGFMDTYLWDLNGDGLYEKRMWYDPQTRNLRVTNNQVMVTAHYPMGFPSVSLRLDDYPRLVELYRKTTAAQPLSTAISIRPEPLPPLADGLLANASFEEPDAQDETRPKGWWFNDYNRKATPLYLSESAVDGERYVAIETKVANARAAWRAASGSLSDRRKYRFTGWYRTGYSPSKRASIRCEFKNTANKTIKVHYAPLAHSAEWERFDFALTPPAGTVYVLFLTDLPHGVVGRLCYDGFGLVAIDEEGETTEPSLQVTGLDGHVWKAQGPGEVPVVMADIGHASSPRERTVLDLSPRGYSRLLTGFSRRPCLLHISRDDFSADSLANVDILLLTHFSAEKAMAPAELDALRGFVTRGGTLLLAQNDPGAAARAAFSVLCERFGAKVGTQAMEVVNTSKPERMASSHYAGEGVARWLRSGDSPQRTVPGGWRLYFRGVPVEAGDAVKLVTYDGSALALARSTGRGKVYVFSPGDLISNAFSAFRSKDTFYHCERFPANNRLIDALADELLVGVAKEGPVAVRP